MADSQTRELSSSPINATNEPLTSAPYVRMFQIQNKSVDPSPWLVYPASNKTVWIATLELGKTLLSQIVNFTMVTPSVGISRPVATLTNTVPTDIVYDHVAGRLWIVENDNLAYYNQTAGSIMTAQTFPNGAPQYLAIDSQDHLWLTLYDTDQIAEYEPQNGATYYYSTPSSNAGLQGIAISPVDGSVWFAEAYAARIGHMVPCNSSACPITEYGPPPGVNLDGIIQVAVDKNGVVWFTRHDGNEFGSFNPSTGEWKLFPIGYCSDNYVDGCEAGLPNAIALDSKGQVWFAEHYGGRIARYDPGSGTLTEYMMPTTSAVCSTACTPYVWWMWPGQNNLVWFVAFGLGEIGYVNGTVPTPYTVNPVAGLTINQGRSVNIPVSADFVGEAPALNASGTSEDTSSNPPMLSWSITPEGVSSSLGLVTSILTISANWGATLGTTYIAVTAYNGNLTVNSFLRVNIVASLAYTTIGFAGGISTFAVAAVAMTRYSAKKKRNNGATPDLSKTSSD
jgi:hypothetical protein